ncbi:MAG: FtsW/RodA/SpoVE family cell cycle protein [Rhabdochlamydiaceae bacterium]
MWDYKYLSRIDWRMVFLIFILMGISLLVVSATTGDASDFYHEQFLTPTVKQQAVWFFLGWLVYFFFAGFNYKKFRDWAFLMYVFMIVLLLGLFFVPSIQNVHRWYRLPGVGILIQPSEYAKLIVITSLSYFLEKHHRHLQTTSSIVQASLLVFIPFVLILKQPDLGTSLILYPITLVMFYFAGVKRKVLKSLCLAGMAALVFVSLMFTGVLSHEGMRPFVTKFMKEYQYERLNPHTYHQQASQTAISLGGWTGTGWRQSDFTGHQWLPAAHTDSVFAAYAEEFGVVGVTVLLAAFFSLLYLGLQVSSLANDLFGKLLAAGISVYLAIHVIVNVGMMCGFLPITGVPLILITYGGSSILCTMTALGILQSVYSRRFMFS